MDRKRDLGLHARPQALSIALASLVSQRLAPRAHSVNCDSVHYDIYGCLDHEPSLVFVVAPVNPCDFFAIFQQL